MFLLKPNEILASLLGRADYSNAAAEVKVVVVERGIKHARHCATDSQQQHGQRATAQTIVIIVALWIRCSSSCTLTSRNLLDAPPALNCATPESVATEYVHVKH